MLRHVVILMILVFYMNLIGAEERQKAHPLLIQATNAQNDHDYVRAQDLFEQYIQTLPTKEQALFTDIVYVASNRDLKVYKRISDSDKAEIKRRFWIQADPSPLTHVNERLIEHYRRVAYARANFGAGRFPWDDRGEVYVRFGAPDHISRSGDMQLEMDREVQDARQNFVNRRRLSLQVTPGQPIFPVPRDTWWSYWVYTDLDKGTEFTFVRRFNRYIYEFAPMPDGLGVGLTADLMAYQGQMVFNDLVSREPWVYQADFSQLPIDFFYYPAAFRGAQGKTRLEIYYGLPASEMARLPTDENSDRILLDRGLAIFDSMWVEQHRIHDQLTLTMPSKKQILDNAFIPGMMTFEVAPGSNYLALQVRDVVSGKSQVYQQALVIDDFSDRETLLMSDIELAFWIGASDKAGEFVKNGLHVVPMASKAFRVDQTAFVFFEIYNLKKDKFEQTKYEIEYVFQSQEKGITPVRALRGLGRMLKLKEKSKEVTVSYEQTGKESDEVAYVELDLQDVEPGAQKVRIEVTDLVADKKVRKEILFEIFP